MSDEDIDCTPTLDPPRGSHHQRHSIERGIVVAERTQRIRDPHKTLRIPAGVEQQIKTVERTFEFLVEFDGPVGREIVSIWQDPRGTT